MSVPTEGDDVSIWGHDGDPLDGFILSISDPFKSGNVTDLSGNPLVGREYTIFVEEEE